MKQGDRSYIVILLIVGLVVHIGMYYHYGFRSLLDANTYIKEADYFLKHNELSNNQYFFYGVPILCIGFFRLLFQDQIAPFVIFQCMLSCVSVLTLYFSSTKIFNSKKAGFFSGLLFLLWVDNLHWNITTMTESLACSFILLLLYVLVYFKETFRDYVLLVGLLFLLFFTRPTAVIIILGVIFFFAAYKWKNLVNKAYIKVFIISCFLLISYLAANVMFSQWDFTEQYENGNIITYVDTIEGSPLYSNNLRIIENKLWRPDSSVKPSIEKIVLFVIYNPVFFVKLAFWKVFYLVTFVRPYYSFWHNVYSFSWTISIYLFFYMGWRQVVNKPIKAFVLTVLVVNCCLIAISSVDWDNRFFIPMEPGLVLLAGGGLVYLIQLLNSRRILKWGDSR